MLLYTLVNDFAQLLFPYLADGTAAAAYRYAPDGHRTAHFKIVAGFRVLPIHKAQILRNRLIVNDASHGRLYEPPAHRAASANPYRRVQPNHAFPVSHYRLVHIGIAPYRHIFRQSVIRALKVRALREQLLQRLFGSLAAFHERPVPRFCFPVLLRDFLVFLFDFLRA